MLRLTALLWSFCLLFALPLRAAPHELVLWHAAGGPAGAALEKLVARFNAAQGDYSVSALRRDDVELLLDAKAAAGLQAGRPALVLLEEARAGAAAESASLIRPLWQVLGSAGASFERSRALPAMAGRYLDGSGRLLAWPLGVATPVLYANKALLRRAGLDPETLPRTWYEMPKFLGALYEQGVACPYTTAWPAWVQMENLSAWHNQAFATRANGQAAGEPKLTFNSMLMIRHVAMLASWAKARYFVYAGRQDEAERRFARGECALLTSASSSNGLLREALGAELAVAALPYYDDFPEAPQNTLSGGSALWAVAGRSQADARGVAAFVNFLSSAPVQAEWQQLTGFLPLSREAHEINRKSGWYKEHAGQETAYSQLTAKPAREHSRGIRIAQLLQIRDIIDEELEAAWSFAKMPKEALDAAVERGNRLLKGGVRPR
jgi:sn-glycerol 3-phosphate transport system substrate-binding protein